MRTLNSAGVPQPSIFTDPKAIVRALALAARAEAKAKASPDGADLVELGEGKRSGDDDTIYRFTLPDNPPPCFARRNVELRIEDAWHDAAVVCIAESEVLLRLDTSFGPYTPPAQVHNSLAWIWERLAEFVSSSAPNKGGLALLRHESRSIPDAIDVPLDQSLILNEGQVLAARAALQHSLSVILGPPGTGKSFVINALVDVLRQHGEQVLALAPTNRASDRLALDLSRRIRPLNKWHRPILRLGTDSSALPAHLRFDRAATERRERIERLLSNVSIAREACGPGDRRRQLDRRAARLESARGEVNESLIRRSAAVVSTVHRTFLSTTLNRAFDTVIVDEASMTPVVMAYCAAMLARKRLILAGDPQQLSAPVKSQEPLLRSALDYLGVSYGEASNLPHDSHIVALTEQHRMASSIAALVSECFYGSTLTTSHTVTRRQRIDCGLGRASVLWTDSGSLPTRHHGDRTTTFVNQTHVELVRTVVGRIPEGPSIAVITPYRAQSMVLRSALKERPDIRVATVHAFQASEADVVVFDIPHAAGMPSTGFLEARASSDNGGRLLCVGLSRARHHLFLLADMTHLLRQLPRDSFVGHVLQRFRDAETELRWLGDLRDEEELIPLL